MDHLPTILLLYFFLLLSGVTWSAAHSTHHYYHPSTSFIHLVGARKGDNSCPGIGDVKSYLHRFGYLNDLTYDSNQVVDDLFDDALEHGLLAYQDFFKLNKTGVLDHDTISMMSKPRCGLPDILNITSKDNVTRMDHFNDYSSRHYQLYPGKPRRTKKQLYVEIQANIPQQLKDAISQAFADWEPYLPLKFLKASGSVIPDIKAGFFKKDHGDKIPFDGPNGILAHATVVYGSSLHFDAEETWKVGAVPGGYDIGTVARHEIGHSLGLGHSNVENALMYPSIDKGKIRKISADDIEGIKALYFR